jgi:outer membrane protein TolC
MEANESVARKNGLPKIGVGVDYVFVNERTDIEIPNNGQDAFMPMVSFSIPIFRGKNNSQIEEARILQAALANRKVEVENNLISNLENSLFELYRAEELNKLYDDQIKKTEQVIKILYTEYGNSGNDFEEILRMQQQLLKYEMAKSTITKEFYLAQARLEYITSKTEDYEPAQ